MFKNIHDAREAGEIDLKPGSMTLTVEGSVAYRLCVDWYAQKYPDTKYKTVDFNDTIVCQMIPYFNCLLSETGVVTRKVVDWSLCRSDEPIEHRRSQFKENKAALIWRRLNDRSDLVGNPTNKAGKTTQPAVFGAIFKTFVEWKAATDDWMAEQVEKLGKGAPKAEQVVQKPSVGIADLLYFAYNYGVTMTPKQFGHEVFAYGGETTRDTGYELITFPDGSRLRMGDDGVSVER